jgi:hypothetical protein
MTKIKHLEYQLAQVIKKYEDDCEWLCIAIYNNIFACAQLCKVDIEDINFETQCDFLNIVFENDYRAYRNMPYVVTHFSTESKRSIGGICVDLLTWTLHTIADVKMHANNALLNITLIIGLMTQLDGLVKEYEIPEEILDIFNPDDFDDITAGIENVIQERMKKTIFAITGAPHACYFHD